MGSGDDVSRPSCERTRRMRWIVWCFVGVVALLLITCVSAWYYSPRRQALRYISTKPLDCRVSFDKVSVRAGNAFAHAHKAIPARFAAKVFGQSRFERWFGFLCPIEDFIITSATSADVAEIIRRLSYFPELRMLRIGTPDIDHSLDDCRNLNEWQLDAFRHLEDLKELEYLQITGVSITDTHLEPIARLPQLKYLWLQDAKVKGDAFMKPWASAGTLKELTFYGVPFHVRNGSGLEQFEKLQTLEFIFCDLQYATWSEAENFLEIMKRLKPKCDVYIGQ